MVIYYRNKFLKVFGLSMLLFVFIIVVGFLSLGWLFTNVDNNLWVIILSKAIPIAGYIAWGLYAWSHYLLTKAKGYSGWLTALFLIPIIGLAIIAILPDKHKNTNLPQ